MSERELFLAALEFRDPQERVRYLDQACAGDAALRAKVEALFKSHEEAGDFLEEPAAFDEAATIAQTNPSDARAGTLRDRSSASAGHSPEPTPPDSEATEASTAGPVAGAASSRIITTGDWTTDAGEPDRTAGGNGAAPDLDAAPPYAISATTSFRKSWAGAAWASSTRRGRSRSTGRWRSR